MFRAHCREAYLNPISIKGRMYRLGCLFSLVVSTSRGRGWRSLEGQTDQVKVTLTTGSLILAEDLRAEDGHPPHGGVIEGGEDSQSDYIPHRQIDLYLHKYENMFFVHLPGAWI